MDVNHKDNAPFNPSLALISGVLAVSTGAIFARLAEAPALVIAAYRVGLPSLAVTLAGLIGFRGAARILLEDRSIGNFPEWFDRLGQEPLIGPFPFALILFVVLFFITLIVLQYSGFATCHLVSHSCYHV